ncbi:MAG: helix-turn-helix transcriptional regulator [Kiritimatiellae bacterium]|nr:helix-turn-helix transcriptional regulator [Kiritimatiellia bacterium]
MLAEYIRTDALLGRFFDVFLFEESIVRRCVEAGLPKPEYYPDNVDFKAVIWRNPDRLSSGNAQSGPSQGAVGTQSGRSQSAVRAQSPREACLVLLVGSELKRKEIADRVGMQSRSGYLSRLLAELVEDGLIERTIPDKPNSSQQRYRLTDKGRQVCSAHKG